MVSAFSLKNWLTGFIAYDVETQNCEDQATGCKKDCLTPYTSCLRTCDSQANSGSESCLTNCNTQNTACSTTCRQTSASCAETVRAGTTRMTMSNCDQNARTCSNNCAQAKTTCTTSCNSGFNVTSCKNTCTETQNTCNQENNVCDEQLQTCKQQVEQQYPPKDCSLESMKHNEFKCKTTRILQQCVDGTLNNIPCENGCNSVQNICNAPITDRQPVETRPVSRTEPITRQPSSITTPERTTTPPLSTRPSSRQTPSSQTSVSPTITQQERLKKQIDQLLSSKQAGRMTNEDVIKSIQRLFPGLNVTNVTLILTEIPQGTKTIDDLKQELYKLSETQQPSSQSATTPSTTQQTTPLKSDIDKRLTYLLQKKNEGKISDQVLVKSLLSLFRSLDNETITKLITDLNNGVLTIDTFKESMFKAEEEQKQKQQQAVEGKEALSTDNATLPDNTTAKTSDLGTINTKEVSLETSTKDDQTIKSFDEVFQGLVGNTLTEEQVNEEIKKLLPEASPEEIEAFKKQIKEGSLNKEDLKKKLEEIKKKEDVAGETADETTSCSVIAGYSPEDVCYQQVIADDEACCSGENGWDDFCENSYQACADPDSFKTKICSAESSYSNENECYTETIKEDVMCCNEEWDEFCQEEYNQFVEDGVCEVPPEEAEEILEEENDDEFEEYFEDEFEDTDYEEDYEYEDYDFDSDSFDAPDLLGYDFEVSSEFEDNLEVNRIRDEFEFDAEEEGIAFEDKFDVEPEISEELPSEEEQVEEGQEILTPEQTREKQDQEIQRKLANNKLLVLRNDEGSGVRLGKNQHRELVVGTIVSKGTRIATNDLGSLVLATQEVRVRAEPALKLEVKKVKYTEKTKEIIFGLEYGITKINKNRNALAKISIETPNAIIDIDGAAEVEYNETEEETIIRVAEGSVIVKSKVESRATEVYKNTETRVKGTPNLLLRVAYFIKG